MNRRFRPTYKRPTDAYRLFKVFLFCIVCAIFVFIIAFVLIPLIFPSLYESAHKETASTGEALPTPKAVHLKTPTPLKAIYMTSWVAGTRNRRNALIQLIDTTEINAVVIDIKDYSGKISFEVSDPKLKELGASEVRISDIKEFLALLHEKGIYTIGRVAVFQDPHLMSVRPDLAVKKSSAKEEVWKDYKGISWIDAGSREAWKYAVLIAREAYSLGFDEINFDYIRFPSDGNMRDIHYPISDGREKRQVMREFFAFLRKALPQNKPVISADFFGMTTTNTDDLNIGQVLEDALPYFDYISPMVYPSHYPTNFIGIKNPASKPYEVIKYSLDKAFTRASTTPKKIRPWLQDFDLGADYTPEMVRSEIQAVYDSGFDSWMLWSPSNTYTEGALEKSLSD